MQADDEDEATGPDDAELFRRQMQDVVPLKHDQRVSTPRPRRAARIDRAPTDDRNEDRFADFDIEEDVPEVLSFARPGIQHNKLTRLRQGKLRIEDSIDLHGSTVAQARDYLSAFLAECSEQRIAVVRIVHGKGNRSRGKVPVIKAMLNRWLREATEVLAFHSCPQHDGGTGAVYVLLKRQP